MKLNERKIKASGERGVGASPWIIAVDTIRDVRSRLAVEAGRGKGGGAPYHVEYPEVGVEALVSLQQLRCQQAQWSVYTSTTTGRDHAVYLRCATATAATTTCVACQRSDVDSLTIRTSVTSLVATPFLLGRQPWQKDSFVTTNLGMFGYIGSFVAGIAIAAVAHTTGWRRLRLHRTSAAAVTTRRLALRWDV